MRYIPLTLALFAASLLPIIAFAADTSSPNFTGTWQLNAAKSQTDHSENVTLEIQDVPNRFTLVRHVQEGDGKEVVSHFSCATNGTQCEFIEGDHKGKGSAWHDGASLFILESDGPKDESSAEWQIELSPDGKTLNVKYNLLAPTDRTEKRVFDKTS